MQSYYNFPKSYISMQNEFGFERNAAASRFAAKRMSEILNTYIAFRLNPIKTQNAKQAK